jgi:hypothetical protein
MGVDQSPEHLGSHCGHRGLCTHFDFFKNKLIVLGFPTAEELYRNLKAAEVNMRRGSGTSEKVS